MGSMPRFSFVLLLSTRLLSGAAFLGLCSDHLVISINELMIYKDLVSLG